MVNRTLFTGLALFFTFVFTPTTFALSLNNFFLDVYQGEWFYGYVKEAAELGIANGYRNEKGELTGYFGPDDAVLVSEAVKMAIEAIGINPDDYQIIPYNTSMWPEDQHPWWHKYYVIASHQNLNITTTCSFVDGSNFNSKRPIFRWEMARLVADIYNLIPDLNEDIPDDLPNPYSDLEVEVLLKGDVKKSPVQDTPVERSKMDYLAYEDKNQYAVLRLTEDGVLSGDDSRQERGERNFRLFDPLSRAEAVKVMIEAKNKYPSSDVVRPFSFELEDRHILPCTG